MHHFHSTFKKLFSGIFTKSAYTENEKLTKNERRELGYYRGPTKGHARMGEKVKEYADEFKEERNVPSSSTNFMNDTSDHSLKRNMTSASPTRPRSST